MLRLADWSLPGHGRHRWSLPCFSPQSHRHSPPPPSPQVLSTAAIVVVTLYLDTGVVGRSTRSNRRSSLANTFSPAKAGSGRRRVGVQDDPLGLGLPADGLRGAGRESRVASNGNTLRLGGSAADEPGDGSQGEPGSDDDSKSSEGEGDGRNEDDARGDMWGTRADKGSRRGSGSSRRRGSGSARRSGRREDSDSKPTRLGPPPGSVNYAPKKKGCSESDTGASDSGEEEEEEEGGGRGGGDGGKPFPPRQWVAKVGGNAGASGNLPPSGGRGVVSPQWQGLQRFDSGAGAPQTPSPPWQGGGPPGPAVNGASWARSGSGVSSGASVMGSGGVGGVPLGQGMGVGGGYAPGVAGGGYGQPGSPSTPGIASAGGYPPRPAGGGSPSTPPRTLQQSGGAVVAGPGSRRGTNSGGLVGPQTIRFGGGPAATERTGATTGGRSSSAAPASSGQPSDRPSWLLSAPK